MESRAGGDQVDNNIGVAQCGGCLQTALGLHDLEVGNSLLKEELASQRRKRCSNAQHAPSFPEFKRHFGKVGQRPDVDPLLRHSDGEPSLGVAESLCHDDEIVTFLSHFGQNVKASNAGVGIAVSYLLDHLPRALKQYGYIGYGREGGLVSA